MCESVLWSNTRQALLELQSLLQCGVCKKKLDEPHWLRNCGHFFCRLCVEDRRSESCAVCRVPCIVKDIQPSRQLTEAVNLSGRLASALNVNTCQSVIADNSTVDISARKDYTENSIMADNILPKCLKEKDATDIVLPRGDRNVENESTMEQSISKQLVSDGSNTFRRSGEAVNENSRTNRETCRRTLSVVQLGVGEIISSAISDEHKKEHLTSAEEITDNQITETCQTKRETNVDSMVYEYNPVLRKRKLSHCEKKSVRGTRSAKRLRSITNLSDYDTADCRAIHDNNNDKANDNANGENSYDDDVSYQSSFKNEMALKQYSAGRKRKLIFTDRSSESKCTLEGNTSLQNLPNLSSGTIDESIREPSSSKAVHKEGNANEEKILADKACTSTCNNSESKSKCDRKVQKALKQAKLDSSGNLVTSKSKKSARQMDVQPADSSAVSMKSFNISNISSSTPKPMKRNAKGETALHVAVIKGDRQRVALLLQGGADPNVKDNASWTPLHEACNHGYVEIAEMLLRHGALINTPGCENATPLHDAVENCRLDCVKLLVSWGASKTMRDLQGRTVLDMAVTEDMKDALIVPVLSKQRNERDEHAIDHQTPVILTTSLSHKERSEVTACAEKLGWKYTTVFSPQVTHVVTMIHSDGSCPRTVKYLQAVLTGKWVVNMDWITTCVDFSRRISEGDFEVSGSTLSPRSLGPSRGRKNASMQLPGLFSGCNFYFLGEFHSPAPPREELISLVRLASANILSREPKLETLNELDYTVPFHAEERSVLSRCDYYIVCDTAATDGAQVKVDDIVVLNDRLCRVTSAWILASISEFRLRTPKRSHKSGRRN